MGRPARIDFHLSQPLSGLSCVFTVVDEQGYSLAKFNSRWSSSQDRRGGTAENCLTCLIDEWPLAPGRYRLDVIVYAAGEIQDAIEGAICVEVERGPFQGREPPRSTNDWKLAVPHRWQLPFGAESGCDG
jgi:hypothetical protein